MLVYNSQSAATNVFDRQTARTQSIPFPLVNGISEMSLQEISGIIAECRQGRWLTEYCNKHIAEIWNTD